MKREPLRRRLKLGVTEEEPASLAAMKVDGAE
ncbi:MAG: hypothetical protein QOD48_1296 [Gaiellaceae bacterium]|jgi:hypothetical protein|nr:hypothetical protein [Gaiellaceae bacterium]